MRTELVLHTAGARNVILKSHCAMSLLLAMQDYGRLNNPQTPEMEIERGY